VSATASYSPGRKRFSFPHDDSPRRSGTFSPNVCTASAGNVDGTLQDATGMHSRAGAVSRV